MIRTLSLAIGAAVGLFTGAAVDHFATDVIADKLAPVVAVVGLVAVLVCCVVAVSTARREVR